MENIADAAAASFVLGLPRARVAARPCYKPVKPLPPIGRLIHFAPFIAALVGNNTSIFSIFFSQTWRELKLA